MTRAAESLFRLIDEAVAEIDASVDSLHADNREAASHLSGIAKQRTDALVELAGHYLPDLTHDALAKTWHEVRDQLHDVLLRRDDVCRRYRDKLVDAKARRHQCEIELARGRERLEEARVEFGVATKAFQDSHRVDPRVEELSEQINATQRQLEESIAAFKRTKADAGAKLPDYEACELFTHLRDKHFGTDQYQGRGIERRWDRWIAKLIDFRDSNASYRHLAETPPQIADLIREKQTGYRLLLAQIDNVRQQTKEQRQKDYERFGVADRKEAWQRLGVEVVELESELEQSEWDVVIIESDLEHALDVHGDHYEEAIEVYFNFLDRVEPEVLKVYAACTASPIDDQIAARVRHLESELAEAKQSSQGRSKQIDGAHRFRSALSELSGRLRDHVQRHVDPPRWRDDFQFEIILADLRQQTITPEKAWRLTLHAIEDVSRPILLKRGELAGLLDATFLAAAQPEQTPQPAMSMRPYEIVISPGSSHQSITVSTPFETIATCSRSIDGESIVEVLQGHGIQCFMHSKRWDLVGVEVADTDEVCVQVDADRFDEARRILLDRLRLCDTAWDCPECDSPIDRGYHRCWRCGKRKSAKTLPLG